MKSGRRIPGMKEVTLGGVLEQCRVINGHWNWQGPSMIVGDDMTGRCLPCTTVDGRSSVRIRRSVYEVAYGETLTNWESIHPRCGVETCLRPSHLASVPRHHEAIWLAAHPPAPFQGNGLLLCAVCQDPLATHPLDSPCALIGQMENRSAERTHPLRIGATI